MYGKLTTRLYEIWLNAWCVAPWGCELSPEGIRAASVFEARTDECMMSYHIRICNATW